MTDSKMFFKECSQWVNKLTNKTLIGSGFESTVESKIIDLNAKDFSSKNKYMINWANGNYKKEVAKWCNDPFTEEIWSKLKF